MRIAIVGAGGVGGYYGGMLARAGHEVAMLVRQGPHLDALRRGGIEVHTPEETFTAPVTASDDVAALGAADFCIVAVKSYALDFIAPAARRLAEGGAVVVPLLNGVDIVERLEAGGVPAAQLLGGMTEISAVRTAPGVVERRSPFQRIAVGEMDGGEEEAGGRAARLVAALKDAGVEARVSPDITADLWRKFAFISTMAAACGLARAPIGPVRAAPLGRLLLARAVAEVMAVGRRHGVALDADEEAKVVARLESMPSAMKPSFVLDLEAGGPTELDDLSGAVSRLGRMVEVETPVHDTATAALSAR
jgi:2-dehydropantoate 2-reductase